MNPQRGTTLARAGLIPQGPLTLSAQFPGTSTHYDYFIPTGSTPKVGDIILTSQSWGLVPGTGKLKDNILAASAGRAMPMKKGPKVLTQRDPDEEDDDDPFKTDVEDVVYSFADEGTAYNPATGQMAIAAALSFVEEMKPAIVTSLHESTSPKAHRFYIMSIPIGDIATQKRVVDGMVARTVKMIKARARLTEIVREQAEMDLFRKVAANNPEAQELIRVLEGKDADIIGGTGDTNKS